MSSTPAAPAQRQLTRRRKLAYAALVCVLFFGGAELILRTLWTPPTERPIVGQRNFMQWLSNLATRDVLAGPLYERDPSLLWRFVPGAKVETTISHKHPKGEEQPIRITINADGYRGRRIQPELRDAVRILCLGDSNFFGYPLDDAHAFPKVLQDKLQQLHPTRVIEVINGGVPGYTIAQGARLFDQKFRRHRFDVVLLSFLNNDAWHQPEPDSVLFGRQESKLAAIAQACRVSYVYRFLASFVPEPDPETFVPRVPLAEFEQRYRTLIDRLRAAGSRVVIVDHCAYPENRPHSQALQKLARERKLGYFGIADRVAEALEQPESLQRYHALAERVMRRWGREVLRRVPHLILYAEHTSPEHLNELGVAWLCDAIAPTLLPR